MGNRPGNPRSHGNTIFGTASPTYVTWLEMKGRCSNPNRKDAQLYFQRGIKVCDRWLRFENFLMDMGCRPNGCTIDRIDPSGNYEPSNCRWATAKEQGRNKRNVVRLTIDGVTKPLIQWSEESGITYSSLRSRIKRGWDIPKAVFTPNSRKHVIAGGSVCHYRNQHSI